MELMTRREIIKAWEVNENYHDFFCCPDCRDVLSRCGDILACENQVCGNTEFYTLDGTLKRSTT